MKKYLVVDPRIRGKINDLIDQPIIIRVTKFNEDSAKDFADDMGKAHQTHQPVIPVVIDSYGGQVYSLLDMISQIKAAHLPVITIVTGKAMSCGAMLFMFGKKRYISEDATLMIHPVSSNNGGKVEEVKASTNETDRLNQRIFRMAAQELNLKPNFFLQEIQKRQQAEWYLTSKEAKRLNIASHIGTPELRVKISLEYEFE